MKNHEQTVRNAAMKALHMVQMASAADQHFVMGEIAEKMIKQDGMSRATAYRYICAAVDFLGIFYDPSDPVRIEKQRSRAADGLAIAHSIGYPNGAPGRLKRSI